MFDSQAFRSWPSILIGAGVFAGLFGLMVAMGEALFDGSLSPSSLSLGIAISAFVGYLGVALLLRYEGR